jgi:hypothetical protein
MIVCNRCREPNPDDAVHCSSCRAYLGWSRGSAAPGGQTQQQPPAAQPPQQWPGQQRPGQQWPAQPPAQPPYEQQYDQQQYDQQQYEQPYEQQRYDSGQPYEPYQQQPYHWPGQRPAQQWPDPNEQRSQPPAQWPDRDPRQPPAQHWPQPPQPGPYGSQHGGPAAPPGIDTGPVPGAPPEQPPPRAVVTPPGARRTVNTVQLGRVTPIDPLAPRVPERTIGVSIAGDQQTRVAPRNPTGPPPPPDQSGPGGGAGGGTIGGFDAVQPQEQADLPRQPLGRVTAPHGVPAPAPSAARPLESGELRCPVCGNAVPAGRRFCRCGNSLVRPAAAASTGTDTRRLPWYRRLGEMFGSGRDFRRSMRAANRGMRATYNVGVSARTQLFRATFLLGSLGIGVAQFGPWGGDLRARVTSQIDRFLPHSYETVPVDQTTTDPATKALPGFDVGFAADGDPGRAWAAPWAPVGTNGQPCHRAGGAPALVITFKQPSAVARVIVQAGLAEGNDERPRQARPRLVDLLFSDGTCTPVDLTDSAGPQQFDVKAAGVTSVRAVIVDAYDARDATGPPLVSLSELTFQRQK